MGFSEGERAMTRDDTVRMKRKRIDKDITIIEKWSGGDDGSRSGRGELDAPKMKEDFLSILKETMSMRRRLLSFLLLVTSDGVVLREKIRNIEDYKKRKTCQVLTSQIRKEAERPSKGLQDDRIGNDRRLWLRNCSRTYTDNLVLPNALSSRSAIDADDSNLAFSESYTSARGLDVRLAGDIGERRATHAFDTILESKGNAANSYIRHVCEDLEERRLESWWERDSDGLDAGTSRSRTIVSIAIREFAEASIPAFTSSVKCTPECTSFRFMRYQATKTYSLYCIELLRKSKFKAGSGRKKERHSLRSNIRHEKVSNRENYMRTREERKRHRFNSSPKINQRRTFDGCPEQRVYRSSKGRERANEGRGVCHHREIPYSPAIMSAASTEAWSLGISGEENATAARGQKSNKR
ncbi:hypothetical protein SCHPADRAFT_926538 [Schizopora paradoxa]|uniref:Uncharacterized protein n=1 Tax=Schizopora paradoxa TaxID=27342 RepID=A0A0H2RWP7_9AGAM|nr:hypothetical protein SCHPADRAFT_926538 [Schizopora paradoxa]